MAVVDEILACLRCYLSVDKAPNSKNLAVKIAEPISTEWVKKFRAPDVVRLGDRALGPLEVLCAKHSFPRGKRDEVWLTRAQPSRKSLSALRKINRHGWQSDLVRGVVSPKYVNDDSKVMSADQNNVNSMEVEEEYRLIRAMVAPSHKHNNISISSSPFHGFDSRDMQPLVQRDPFKIKIRTRSETATHVEVFPKEDPKARSTH